MTQYKWSLRIEEKAKGIAAGGLTTFDGTQYTCQGYSKAVAEFLPIIEFSLINDLAQRS